MAGAIPASAQPAPTGKPADKPADKPPATLDARIKALEIDLEDAKDASADLKSEVADLGRSSRRASRGRR